MSRVRLPPQTALEATLFEMTTDRRKRLPAEAFGRGSLPKSWQAQDEAM